jgi:hypothetical protein
MGLAAEVASAGRLLPPGMLGQVDASSSSDPIRLQDEDVDSSLDGQPVSTAGLWSWRWEYFGGHLQATSCYRQHLC